jgi:hypothetical protein
VANITDNLCANVVIPESGTQQIEVYIDHVALCLAIAEREGAASLSTDWNVPGVYILLDSSSTDGTWACYVGKAPMGLRTRVVEHIGAKNHWSRALLVRRDTKYGFHSAQVGWLEGRLYDLLHAAQNAELHNKVRPTDETLPPHDRQMLESCIMPISRVLRLIGHDPTAPGETPPLSASQDELTETNHNHKSPAKHKKTKIYGTVRDLLEAGLLTPHTTLVSTNRVWPGKALVLPDGRIGFNDRAFNAPSAAAGALTGGSVNGWIFWAVESDTGLVTLATLRARLNGGPR